MPLQNQAMSTGRSESRFTLDKRTFPKPINISSEILLDRERCVLCQRCTRFADEIAGEPFIELKQRGAQQQIGIGEEPFDSYFSGNTVQICPVGRSPARNTASGRGRSTWSACPPPVSTVHRDVPCAPTTDTRPSCVVRPPTTPRSTRNGTATRVGSRSRTSISTDLNCPWCVTAMDAADVVARSVAGGGGRIGHCQGRAAVFTGGRLTLGTPTRTPDSPGSRCAPTTSTCARGSAPPTKSGSCRRGSRARPVPRTGSWNRRRWSCSSPSSRRGVTHRLPAAAQGRRLRYRRGVDRAVRQSWPGADVRPTGVRGPRIRSGSLGNLPSDVMDLLGQPGAVIMVGERAAERPVRWRRPQTWPTARVPRWRGCPSGRRTRRGGHGCLPGLLPGGRPLSDPAARREVAGAWGIAADDLPDEPGRSLPRSSPRSWPTRRPSQRRTKTNSSRRSAPCSLPGSKPRMSRTPMVPQGGQGDPVRGVPGSQAVRGHRAGGCGPAHRRGHRRRDFRRWEGRRRPFDRAFPDATTFADADVLALLTDYLDLDPAPRSVAELRAEITALGAWAGAREWTPATTEPAAGPRSGPGESAASWRMLLDLGVEQEGRTVPGGHPKPSVARLSQPPLPVSASRMASPSGCPPITEPSRCRPPSPTWPTGSCGCRPSARVPGESHPPGAPGDTVRLGRSELMPELSVPSATILLVGVPEDPGSLRHPGPAGAVHHLGRTARRCSHADAYRPQPNRPVRSAPVPHGRFQAGAEGRDHPHHGAQGRVLAGAADQRHLCLRGLRCDPLRSGGVDLRGRDPAAVDRLPQSVLYVLAIARSGSTAWSWRDGPPVPPIRCSVGCAPAPR